MSIVILARTDERYGLLFYPHAQVSKRWRIESTEEVCHERKDSFRFLHIF